VRHSRSSRGCAIKSTNRLRTLRFVVALFVAAALFGTAIWTAFNLDAMDPEHIADALAKYGTLSPAAFAAARILGAVVLVPGSVLAIAAGILFGPIWGAVYNVLAATVGAVLAFAIARFVAPNWIERHVGNHVRLEAMIEAIDAEGWHFVAFVRLVPIFPYNVLNYALGLTSIRLLPYTLATLICMIPVDLAYSYLGYAGREALTGQTGSVQTVLLALAGFAALIFVPMLVRRYRRRRDALLEADHRPD
jgi:uncharacterized membrane protein YdjX (TVP38/TMEM64 family)